MCGACTVHIDGKAVEDALAGATLDEDVLSDAAAHAGDSLDTSMLMDDLQASAEFRAQLLEVYTDRALAHASKRAGLALKA